MTDATGPLITLNSPANASVQTPGTTIDFSITDPNGVIQVTYNWDSGGNMTLFSPYDVILPASSGPHMLKIFAEDNVTNVASASYIFTTDGFGPLITLNSPVNNSVHSSGLTIDLSITDPNGVVLVTYTWDGSGNTTLFSPFDLTLPALDGSHILYIVAHDNVSNMASQTYVFVTDDANPQISSPPADLTFEAGTPNQNLDWSVNDAKMERKLFPKVGLQVYYR